MARVGWIRYPWLFCAIAGGGVVLAGAFALMTWLRVMAVPVPGRDEAYQEAADLLSISIVAAVVCALFFAMGLASILRSRRG